MTAPTGGKGKVRSGIASLAIWLGLALAPGCGQDAGTSPTSEPKPPPNPVPRSDLGVPVVPKLPRSDRGGETKDISNVEKDLRKDLGAPVIKPDTPASTAPPATKPEAAKTGPS
jgi:hypothetical protein